MTDKKELGIKGEKFAVRYLKKNKYRIILRNFSCHFGEIDIIARKDNYIVFVEVKTRKEDSMLLPRFAVDNKKQKKIINTSEFFLRKYKTDLIQRYDIAEVFVNDKNKFSIEYLENAFYAEKTDIYKR